MTDSDLRPTPEVDNELRDVLRRNQSRLGDTFRGLEAGKSHREIADDLGVATHGFGYNNQATIEAIFDGRRSDSPVPTRVTRSRVSSLLKHASLSPDARAYLEAVLAELDSQVLPATGWDDFVHWSEVVRTNVNLVAQEDDWKRGVAKQLDTALEGLSEGTVEALHAANTQLAKSGLLASFFVIQLRNVEAGDPEGLAALFANAWTTDLARFDVDEFAADLRALVEGASPRSKRVTPGDVTALASLLLMARDPSNHPPYRPTPAGTVARLSGVPAGASGDPGQRYSEFLAWLDVFIDEAARREVDIPNRLSAQGIAWAIAKGAPTDWGFPTDLARDFLRWRGVGPEPQRAWLVRPAQGGPTRWLEECFVSLPATHLGEVEPGADETTVKVAVEEGYTAQDYAQRKSLTKEYHAFLTLMHPDDVVVVQTGTNVSVGTIASDPLYRDEEGYRLVREAVWVGSAPSAELAPPLPSLLDLQGNVVEITQGLAGLREVLSTGVWPPPVDLVGPKPPDKPQVRPAVTPDLPAITPEVAARLHTSSGALQEILDLLGARRQVVLYGPPGTGKTYLAQALAAHVVGPEHGSRVQLVQFHPSYAYEDFIEGFRPTLTDEGQASFELQPGPLRRIAAEALEHPGEPYVLIIDELNRANLAKVFGELYFLLEYRDKFVNLQYQPDKPFSLPNNLFIIGTMNTADRSIALLDAAMRRRFSFIELHPDEDPVRHVLGNWLRANDFDGERARLLAALNEAIEDQDRDLRIGPSYLMRPEAGTEKGLARVWKYDILPLLEEHYYGRLTREQLHDRFGLAALRAGLRGDEEDGDEGDTAIGDGGRAGLAGAEAGGVEESPPSTPDPAAADASDT